MLNLKIIKELDDMAMAIIRGEIEPIAVSSLQVLDEWLVLSFVHIYSSCINGTISRVSCVELKKNLLRKYERFVTRLAYTELTYYMLKEATVETSTKSCEITRALNEGDFKTALINSLECLDRLENSNIYIKMFEKAAADKSFKKEMLRAGNESIDGLMDKYGCDVPYARMIERFFAVANENHMTEIFAELDPEKFRESAEYNTPQKSDDRKVIVSTAENLKRMYGVRI